MIHIQGHTSVESQSQTLYSGLEPGTVHHKAAVHYDGFTGLISHGGYSADTTQGALCHEPSASSYSQSCCPSSPPESHDFAEEDSFEAQASPELQVCLLKMNPGKQLPRESQLPHLFNLLSEQKRFQGPNM